MPDFIFVYHGGSMPDTPQDVEKAMAEWGAWFDGMGTAIVLPGDPVGKSSTVFSDRVEDNGGPNPISGYSVVTAADLDAAISMAQGCPILHDGAGSVEVAEIHAM
jgi:hypothetical protein